MTAQLEQELNNLMDPQYVTLSCFQGERVVG